jgi:hypothetical protein
MSDYSTLISRIVGLFTLFTFVGVLSTLYLLPTIVALVRGYSSRASVAAINIFLGWTLVGWAVALSWALKAEERK